MARLYAKSPPKNLPISPSIFLPQHLIDVHDAALKILRRTGENQLSAMSLPSSEWLQRLERSVRIAAIFHDLGKANDHFQSMLTPNDFPNRAGKRQGIRHEWVTLLYISELTEWLASVAKADELVWNAAVWSITGHHPKYGRPSPPKGDETTSLGNGSEVKLLCDSDDFRDCLRAIGNVLGIRHTPSFPSRTIPLVGTNNAFRRIGKLHRVAAKTWGTYMRDPSQLSNRKFVAAVKNCLIAADVAGSAIPKDVPSERQSDWIESCFDRQLASTDLDAVIASRLLDGNGTKHNLRPFQLAVASEASDVTFVKAGCGCGKTLAAYHWARTHCPGKRLYICYPTTGTATEGFRDYLVEDDEVRSHAKLFHGRSSVDLEILRVNQSSASDELDRIESLDAWSTPIVNCTVDTVLGMLQNNRRGLYGWPAIAQSAIVFDEIHAYDDRLFATLIEFLQVLSGIPTLLMTASLPQKRFEKLQETVGSNLSVVKGPEDLETLCRYHQQGAVDARDPIPEIKAVHSTGGKVLWVVNTVNRAIDAAARTDSLQPIVYHSRFRYEDRVAQHGQVVDAFRRDGPALAICTQVAEMSLDLSATLLVSDLAPIPSLIQRLGRLNRRAQPPKAGEASPETMPFIVTDRGDGKRTSLPYSTDELAASRTWLSELPKSNVSQRNLAATWESNASGQDGLPQSRNFCWIDGGPVTEVESLRESSPGMTVIMEKDVSELVSRRKRLASVLLPMPPRRSDDWQTWDNFKGIPIAPSASIDYCASTGASWKSS